MDDTSMPWKALSMTLNESTNWYEQ